MVATMSLLAGVRVLDLSRILAGPWATQVLADFGAEVIKIERPGAGDDTRTWGPPYLQDGAGHDTTESAYYLCANRGKRSLAIDFTCAQGQALIRGLAARSDVLVENYKVGGLQKYGLDFASLQAVNPKLVYCSITGYGQDGPYAQRAGYDAAIQAIGGLMSVTGEPDGEPGAGPQKVGVAATDLMTGMYAATAILAALRHAERTGTGQHIDLALLDTQVAFLANQGMNYLATGEAPGRLGNAHPNIVPYQTFKTQDGAIILACGNDNLSLGRAYAESHGVALVDHYGFIVDSVEELDAWYQYLKAQGVTLLDRPFDHGDGARSFHLLEPAGNKVQPLYHPAISGQRFSPART